jgi:uncharacterized membrane protein
MDSFFQPDNRALLAAAVAGGIALVLGLLWAFLTWARRQSSWPVLLAGLAGAMVWLVAALALFWDGSSDDGLLLTLLTLGLLFGVCPVFLLKNPSWLAPIGFVMLAIGALVAPHGAGGLWLTGIAALALLISVAVVILTGKWWTPIGYVLGSLTLLFLGGIAAWPVAAGMEILATNLVSAGSIRASSPFWLLLLLLIPVLILWSYRGLAGLGQTRRAIALGLRSCLVLFLACALAEVYLLHANDVTTVLFLWDRSLSMPEEFDPGDTRETPIDQAKKRQLDFINNAVALRGTRHQRDQAGVIIFGRYPRLELPPASVPHFNLRKTSTSVDAGYTDIGAAIKLALACFPEGTGKRIVLVSDGNENLGKATEQARIAKQNGVEIDTVLAASGSRNQSEILVERIEAPPAAETDTRMPIRIVLRSYNPQTVIGRLSLTKTSLKMNVDPADPTNQLGIAYKRFPVEERLVSVNLGLNGFYLQQSGLKDEKESYTYEAKFVPIGVVKGNFDLENPDWTKLDKEAVKGDRPENNYATTSVLARGEKRILFIEPEIGDHALLVKTLKSSKGTFKVGTMTPAQIQNQVPQDPERLGFFLGGFDCIILANLARDMLSNEMDAALRSAVHEQGVGLIMIGGQNGYGGGGWQDTEVEKALPVTCDLKSMEIEGRSGLVLIMHASEIPEGNKWQKEIAKLAIKKLSPIDMLGMLYYDWGGAGGGHVWHIPFQTVGPNKQRMLNKVDSMQPGDMPDAEPSMKKAFDVLTNPVHMLGTKHVIFISDGDHWAPPVQLLKLYKIAGVTCTTVCITSHGQGEYKNMAYVARATGGREYPAPDAAGQYHPLDPNQLPQIYMKETRLISKAFFYDKPFVPDLRIQAGPTEGLPRALPLLHGFVRATPRAGPLVQIPIMTPKIDDNPWPILAYWQYGLGKGIAFTSDAKTSPDQPPGWDRDWANSTDPAIYGQFWDQLVSYSLRELDQGKNLRLSAERRDGKVFIAVEARDEDLKPMADLDIIVRVTTPNARAGDASRPDIKLEQKNAGRYEAEIRAEDVGAYFFTALASRTKRLKDAEGKVATVREPVGMVRTSVTVPYSPEFAEMEANPALLERLSNMTGGRFYTDDSQTLEQLARSAEVFRASPAQSKNLQTIWHWLLVLAGLGLFFDVAVRRIAIDPAMAADAVTAQWERLRGARAAASEQKYLERLKSRKEQVAGSLEKEKAAKRFEGSGMPIAPPPTAEATGVPPPRPQPAPKPRPQAAPEAEKGDYASRLLKAKKRAMEDRDKDKPV